MGTGEQRQAAGQRLASLRGGKSQAVFGPELGVTKTTLGAYERGERSPDLDFLIRLKELTGASLDWLATGEGDPKLPLAPIDKSVLTGIIAAIEDETPEIDPETKARLIVRLYANRISTKEGEPPAEVERTSRGA